MAHDCRRNELFAGRVCSRRCASCSAGDLPLRDLIGAYAGEIGQTQFLPSSYIKYGVDYDGQRPCRSRHSVPGRGSPHGQPAQDNGGSAASPMRGHAEFPR